MSALVTMATSLDLGRLEEEEKALREVSYARRGAARHTVWLNTWTLFSRIVERAFALEENPAAFTTPLGTVDVKALNAWTKMIGTARQVLADLNKMQDSNVQVSFILDRYTRELIQAISIELGLEFKSILDDLSAIQGADEPSFKVRKLMYRRLPEIFLRSAETTLKTIKEEYGLLR